MLNADKDDWLDCTDMQADWSLHLTHMLDGAFSVIIHVLSDCVVSPAMASQGFENFKPGFQFSNWDFIFGAFEPPIKCLMQNKCLNPSLKVETVVRETKHSYRI